MESYDERQAQIRGKIMTQAVILLIVLTMSLALINDVLEVDVVAMFGFSDIMISIMCVELTFISVSLLWKDAYFGFLPHANIKAVFYIMTVVAIMLVILQVLDLLQHEPISLLSVCAMVMIISIVISMWIKKKDWDIKE